jgi:PST family polysaccharide transporter
VQGLSDDGQQPVPPMARQAAGGALYIGGTQVVRILLGFATTIIVARILTPGDYGVLAMAAPVTAFIVLFQNLGLSHAVVQARTISQEQLNGLFWVNILASIVIAVLLVLAAPGASWFYRDVRAGYIVAASAVTVLLSGTVLLHSALLNREMRFRTISMIDIATSLTGLVVTVAAAFALRSYWALWLGGVAWGIVGAILMWRASPWRPSRQVSVKGTGPMLKFGAGITGFNLLNFFSRNLDNVLIGRLAGPGALGLYDRAYRLMMFPLQNINAPLARLMLPMLAQLRDEPERFRRAYLLAVRSIQLAVIPGVAVAVATSDRIIPFLLGPQWTEASPIFFWLALAGLLQPLGNTMGWLFITSGRTTAMAQWGLFSTVTAVTGFAIGIQWGAVGVAASVFIDFALRSPILYFWAARGTPVHSADLYGTMGWALAYAGAAWLITKLLSPFFPIGALLFLALPLSYLAAIAIHALTPTGRDLLRMIIGQLRSIVRRSDR